MTTHTKTTAETHKMAAVPFEYPKGLNFRQKATFKNEKLHEHQDKLYYDVTSENKKTNLIFKNSSEEGWIRAIKEKYPDSEETEQKWTKLKYHNGTICVYESGEVVVYGKLMDDFETDFEEMKIVVEMGRMQLNDERESPDEAEGEGKPVPAEAEGEGKPATQSRGGGKPVPPKAEE